MSNHQPSDLWMTCWKGLDNDAAWVERPRDMTHGTSLLTVTSTDSYLHYSQISTNELCTDLTLGNWLFKSKKLLQNYKRVMPYKYSLKSLRGPFRRLLYKVAQCRLEIFYYGHKGHVIKFRCLRLPVGKDIPRMKIKANSNLIGKKDI